MKKIIILTIIAISFYTTTTYSQYLNGNNMLYSFGITSEKLLKGIEGSRFGNGVGFSFESYVLMNRSQWAIFSFDYYQNTNMVGDSTIKCKFWTFYYFPLDWRFKIYRPSSGRVYVYWGISAAPQMMKVEGTKGVDWSWIFTGSMGIQCALAGRSYLQIQAKPYFIVGNQLASPGSLGVNAKLSLGFMLKK